MALFSGVVPNGRKLSLYLPPFWLPGYIWASGFLATQEVIECDGQEHCARSQPAWVGIPAQSLKVPWHEAE